MWSGDLLILWDVPAVFGGFPSSVEGPPPPLALRPGVPLGPPCLPAPGPCPAPSPSLTFSAVTGASGRFPHSHSYLCTQGSFSAPCVSLSAGHLFPDVLQETQKSSTCLKRRPVDPPHCSLPLSLFISVCPLLAEGVMPQKPQSHPQCVLLLHLPPSPAAVSGPLQSHVGVRSGFLRLTLSSASLRCLCLGSDTSRFSGQFQQRSDRLLALPPSPGSCRSALETTFPMQNVSERLTARLALPISPLIPGHWLLHSLLLPFPGVLRASSPKQ